MPSFSEYVQSHDTKRGHMLDYWRSLRNNTPIYMEPIPKDHVGSNKAEDTVRVSGSAKFIAGIMSRLKDLIILDNQQTKLDIDFLKSKIVKRSGEETFILYIHSQKR